MKKVVVIAGKHSEFIHYVSVQAGIALETHDNNSIVIQNNRAMINNTVFQYASRPDQLRDLNDHEFVFTGTWDRLPNLIEIERQVSYNRQVKEQSYAPH